jgi:hypothetical protein
VRLLGAFVVATVALLAAPSVSVQPVVATCAAPSVKVKPARVARGGVLTVTGKFFGDDCLDTGTVPAGVGPLGNPLTGLFIVIDQGENEFVVATGSAGNDYAFEVDVVVPAQLEPGEASVALLGAGDARLTTDLPLVITSAPARDAEATVATFGPPTPDTTPPGTVPPPVLPVDIPDAASVTTPPLSTAPVNDDSGADENRRAITVGIAVIAGIGTIGFAIWSRFKRRR